MKITNLYLKRIKFDKHPVCVKDRRVLLELGAYSLDYLCKYNIRRVSIYRKNGITSFSATLTMVFNTGIENISVLRVCGKLDCIEFMNLTFAMLQISISFKSMRSAALHNFKEIQKIPR